MPGIIRQLAIFTLTAAAASAAPVRLNPKNPHYFLLPGKAVVLITSGEHYGAVLNEDFNYRRYLQALAADGLNYTRLFGGSYREVPGKSFGILRNDLAPAAGRYRAPWARSSAPGYAGGGNKFDLDHWDPRFFERFRDFLSEASRQGIVVEVTLFSSHYAEAQWNLSPFNPENNINHTEAINWKNLHTLENGNILAYQERYVRKLVREATAFDNVIFEIQNEPWSDRPVLDHVINPYMERPGPKNFANLVEIADRLSLVWQSRVSEWITSEEANLPKKHLIAQNYCNYGAPVRELVPGVSIVNFHYAYPGAALVNYGLDRAIAYDETGFLGRDDDAYRRQAWNFMLSGGSTFDNLDYSFNVGHEDGSDLEANGPGGGSPALRRQLRVLSEFLQQLPLLDMKPDASVVAHAEGVYARVLASPGREYAVYFDGDGPTAVSLNLPPGTYSAAWVDTKTGAVLRNESFRQFSGEKALRSPAFRDGIALRIVNHKP